ncbi:MAG: DegT/DnrJ/EryC1/StrS family aminotransferase [Chloroflexi bacterium]|nr:DegT/DnrJ/EryC1/StrS family aminotransferase [Chloroflexota bacterium]
MHLDRLAIDGGKPALKRPVLSRYPGAQVMGEEEKTAVLEVIEARSPFRYYGPKPLGKTAQFEQALARHVGTAYALGVSSGTAALRVALGALGIGPGDEVIVPAVTFLASPGAVVTSRAIPVFADVDASLNLDPADVERRITSRTKAIMPVCIQGAPYAIDDILAVAKAHDLLVIEDCAQGLGASYQGKSLGSWGNIGCFSLQLNKVITTGDGGAIVTSDSLLYERALRCHNQGGIRGRETFPITPTVEDFLAENYRMSELHGAVALAQLGKLPGILAAMQSNKRRIKESITLRPGMSFRRIPDEVGDVGAAIFFYVPDRNLAQRVVAALQAENIDADQLYGGQVAYLGWPQVRHQRTITSEGCPFTCPYYGRKVVYEPGLCPWAEDLFGRAIRLSISPLFTADDCAAIAEGVNKVTAHLLT